MVQRHSLIFWAHAIDEDFPATLDKAYNLLSVISEFGPELRPNYLTARRKKDAQKFNLSVDTLRELLKKGANEEGNKIFSDLGYGVSFFSSKREEDSAGIMMQIGARNPLITNSFVVGLPLSIPVFESDQINIKLISIFKRCVEVFDPFWACIGNSLNSRRYNGYWKDQLPSTINWVNYFGDEVTKALGEEKIVTAPCKTERFHSGYILLIKDKPIDNEVEEDIILQQNINMYFGI